MNTLRNQMTKWVGTILLFILMVAPEISFADPSGPWKPELTHRPRLLWEAGDWPDIVSRLDREPYSTLYSRVTSRAARSWTARPEIYKPSREYPNASTAKNAAFVWAVEGDNAMAAKAVEILLDMGVVINWEGLEGLNNLLGDAIHVADGLQGYLIAFDILAGSGGFASPAQEQLVHDTLEQAVVNAWNFYMVDYYFIFNQHVNNHYIKLASAFGTAAIALNDSQHASEWIHLAMSWGATRLYDVTAPEGACAEGPYYLLYSANNYLPFFIQYDRFTGGESGTFEQRYCNALGQNCWYEDIHVTNPLDDPRFADIIRWTVDIRLPDGTCPPFDDGLKRGNLNGLLAGVWQDPELAWDWLNMPGEPLYTQAHHDLSADMICTFDDSVIPAEPERGPSIVYPETAMAMFRTGWDTGADYAMFLAEKGNARTRVPGHEHADNLSFSYWTDGDFRAIDCGYINWAGHEEVRYGVDHNVVAIDGEGPPAPDVLGNGGVDADLTSYDLSGVPEYAVGSTRYAETDWTRSLFFFGDLLIVGDFLSATEDHDYSYLLHGNAGGDRGTFTMLEHGARWELEGEGMDLTVSATGEIDTSHYTDIYGWTYGERQDHEVFSGTVTGSAEGFVSILSPMERAKTTVTMLDLPDGTAGFSTGAGGDLEYFVVDDGTGNDITQTSPKYKIEKAFAWIRPAQNRALVVGRSIYRDDLLLASQTGGVSMDIAWSDSWVEITTDAEEDNVLSLEPAFQYPEVSGDCVEGWNDDEGLVTISLVGACTVRVEQGTPGDDDDDNDTADDNDDTGGDDDDDNDDTSGDDDDDDDSGGC